MGYCHTSWNYDMASGLDVQTDPDGLFHRGFVCDVTDTTLTLDFHSATKPPTTLPLDQIFEKDRSEDFEFTSSLSVEVPYRPTPDDPLTWFQGKILVGEQYTYAFVEFPVGESFIKELFQSDDVHNPEMERNPVEEGTFRKTEIDKLPKELVDELREIAGNKASLGKLEEIWKARGVCHADVDGKKAVLVFRGKEALDLEFLKETVEEAQKGTKRDAEGQEKKEKAASKTADEKHGHKDASDSGTSHVTISTSTFGRSSQEFKQCELVHHSVTPSTTHFTFQGEKQDHNDGWLLHCTLGILWAKDIHLATLTLDHTYPYFGDIIENTQEKLVINERLQKVTKKLVLRHCEVSQFVHSVAEVSSGLTDRTAVVEAAEVDLQGEGALERVLEVFEGVVEELDERERGRVKEAVGKDPGKALGILKKWEPARFATSAEADLKNLDVSSMKKLTQMGVLYTFY